MLKKLLFASTCALASLCFLSERALAEPYWRCATAGNEAFGSTQQEAYNSSLSLCARNTPPAAGVPSPCQPQNVVCQQTGLQPQPQPPRPQPPQPQPPRPHLPPQQATNGALVGIPSIATDSRLRELWAFARDRGGRILYATGSYGNNQWYWTDWREVPG